MLSGSRVLRLLTLYKSGENRGRTVKRVGYSKEKRTSKRDEGYASVNRGFVARDARFDLLPLNVLTLRLVFNRRGSETMRRGRFSEAQIVRI